MGKPKQACACLTCISWGIILIKCSDMASGGILGPHCTKIGSGSPTSLPHVLGKSLGMRLSNHYQ